MKRGAGKRRECPRRGHRRRTANAEDGEDFEDNGGNTETPELNLLSGWRRASSRSSLKSSLSSVSSESSARRSSGFPAKQFSLDSAGNGKVQVEAGGGSYGGDAIVRAVLAVIRRNQPVVRHLVELSLHERPMQSRLHSRAVPTLAFQLSACGDIAHQYVAWHLALKGTFRRSARFR